MLLLPRHSNNVILPLHRLAVLVLRRLDHSMSTRLAILPKQREPDSITSPLRNRPRRLIDPLAIVIELGSLSRQSPVRVSIPSTSTRKVKRKRN